MIQGLSAGYGIHINNGYYGGPYVDSTRWDAGRLRMTGHTMEVYTGANWLPVTNGTTHVELNDEIKEILAWAERKMVEEERISSILKEYPEIADLKGKFDMMMSLVKDSDPER